MNSRIDTNYPHPSMSIKYSHSCMRKHNNIEHCCRCYCYCHYFHRQRRHHFLISINSHTAFKKWCNKKKKNNRIIHARKYQDRCNITIKRIEKYFDEMLVMKTIASAMNIPTKQTLRTLYSSMFPCGRAFLILFVCISRSLATILLVFIIHFWR